MSQRKSLLYVFGFILLTLISFFIFIYQTKKSYYFELNKAISVGTVTALNYESAGSGKSIHHGYFPTLKYTTMISK